MGSRDPFGGEAGTSGEGYDATGGPLGYLAGLVLFVGLLVVLVAVAGGVEATLGAALPGWTVLPLFVLSMAVLAVGGLYAVLRVNEWRRRR